MKESIKIVIPSEDYVRKIKGFKNELLKHGYKTIHGGRDLMSQEDIKQWIEESHDYSASLNLPEGKVASTTFLVVRKKDESVIGVVSLRHELNDYLYNYAGNVSYTIAPCGGKNDYASLMLGQLIQKARILELPRLLITCVKGNKKAEEAILRNGGEFINEVFDPTNAKTIKRYWLS